MKLLVAIFMVAILAGCGEEPVLTKTLLADAVSSAVAATSDGGAIYGDNRDGKIWTVSASGARGATPLATLPVGQNLSAPIRGLVAADDGTIYASYLDADAFLTVARVKDGSSTVIWQGPQADAATTATQHIAGPLLLSSAGRVVMAVGDFGTETAASNGDTPFGKVLTLNGDGQTTQRPNIIASGFSNPSAITYDQGGSLWVADGDAKNDVRIFRVSNSGQRGDETDTKRHGPATGFTHYSDQEFAACIAEGTVLQRFLIQGGGNTAVPGRIIGNDCSGGLAQIKDGNLVYSKTKDLGSTT